MRENVCKFFTTPTNSLKPECEKGHIYGNMIPGERKHEPLAIIRATPCVKENNVNTCSDRRYPTPDEVEKYKKQCELDDRNATALLTHTQKIIEEKYGPFKKGKSDIKDQCDCPLCDVIGGKGLKYARSGYNGHISLITTCCGISIVE